MMLEGSLYLIHYQLIVIDLLPKTDFAGQISPEQTFQLFGLDVDDDAFDNCGGWPMDHDDGIEGERGALIEDGSSVKTKKTKNRKAESEIASMNALDTELIYRMALLLEIIPSYYSFKQIEHRVTGYFLKIVIINLFLRILGSCFSGPMSRAFEGEERRANPRSSCLLEQCIDVA
ncbi:hypothetical protein K7X08_025994 [Anisodus acutangulus]|uniref:Uncharacterized protein n=1 Tax=Anisodus acutangulus TaxID=402998 RepID=A0A9Q1RUP4_9SOLA|nr:hypothetical protein K7X08_025994 [Anisodus acutangulus]